MPEGHSLLDAEKTSETGETSETSEASEASETSRGRRCPSRGRRCLSCFAVVALLAGCAGYAVPRLGEKEDNRFVLAYSTSSNKSEYPMPEHRICHARTCAEAVCHLVPEKCNITKGIAGGAEVGAAANLTEERTLHEGDCFLQVGGCGQGRGFDCILFRQHNVSNELHIAEAPKVSFGYAPAAAPRCILVQGIALAVALMLEFVIAGPPALVDQGARQKVRRGARLKGLRCAVGSSAVSRAYAYRALQVLSGVCTLTQLAFVLKVRYAVLIVVAVRVTPTVLLMGPGSLTNPTVAIVPPGISLTRLHDAKMRSRFLLAAAVADTIAIIAFVLLYVLREAGIYYPPFGEMMDHLEWLGVRNISLYFAWEFAGNAAIGFGILNVVIGVAASIAFCTWSMRLLCSEAGRDQADQARIRAIVEQVEEAATQRLQQIGGRADEADRETAVGNPVLAQFPEGMEPAVAVQCCVALPRCALPVTEPEVAAALGMPAPGLLRASAPPWYAVGWMPGGLAMAFAILIADLFTDVLLIVRFHQSGHHLFGGVSSVFIYVSTLQQLKHGLWGRAWRAFIESAHAGVPTSDWLALHDAEKGWETLPAFMVQLYAIPFQGLSSVMDWLPVLFSFATSLYSLITYLVETHDLEMESDD